MYSRVPRKFSLLQKVWVKLGVAMNNFPSNQFDWFRKLWRKIQNILIHFIFKYSSKIKIRGIKEYPEFNLTIPPENKFI